MNCDFLNYGNKRQIKINREKVSNKDTGRLYLCAYQDNIQFAIQDLSASAFKCYLVFLMQKDKFVMDYSPEYIASIAKVCRDTARKAMRELQEKGYLIQIDEKHYDFYEWAHFTKRKKALDN